MTYWGYHLLFTIPWIFVGCWLLSGRVERAHLGAFAGIGLIVVAFTAPWDNYAVWLGIWGFGSGVSLGYPFSGVSGKTALLGQIPLEEYAFFVIETALVCLASIAWLPVRKRNGGD